MRKVGVLFVHGVGSQGADFAESAKRSILREFEREAKTRDHDGDPSDLISFRPCWWAPITGARQAEYWSKCLDGKLVDDDLWHRFFLNFAGDLISYYQSKGGDERCDGVYSRIHALMMETYKLLRADVGEDGLISIAAHSLGTIIALDFMKYFTKLGDVSNVFLMGSPKGVANTGYRDGGAPGFKLNGGRFINFIDSSDMVAWPLGASNEAWRRAVTDYPVNVGGVLSFWNIGSHTGYQEDSDVARPIAQILAYDSLVRVAPEAES